MLHPVTGDILLTKSEAIAHGVAPNDEFGQGLALALRERYPSMVKDFRHWCHTEARKPGEAWIWSGVGADGHAVRVINLLTQEPAASKGQHPGKASLANVNHALHSLKKLIAAEGLKSVALPRLATGVGGLEWEDVHPLLHKVLDDADCEISVYATYKPGVAGE
ncbi:MAG: macro domain-containing protein [Planctomycetes bacterium]|nr:macro domain-containing protein [Planctomycetota bacterium]